MSDEVSVDFRSVEIEMRILHAIDRPIQRISVDEICKRAGISRQTFYRHFKSKEVVPAWYSAWCEQFYLDEIGRTLSWEIGYGQHMRLMCKEATFLSTALHEGIEPPYFGGYPVSVRRKRVLLDTLRDYRHVAITDDMLFCVEAFVHIETEVFARWCKEGLTRESSLYARRMLSIVPPMLYAALQLP